jgi:asparagine synthase (glutamine-hydrolysing)
MIASMAVRAPDGINVWSNGAAGLAHGALHTTPEGAIEKLPLVRGRAVTITADARLDNRGELLRELGIDMQPGDGELILAAYERWGEGCPEHLLGDFAFAIWDSRSQELFCACDRFAIKPLCWHSSHTLFAVATEIKGLLALPEIPRRFNEQRFADFLTEQMDDPVSTVYKDVYRLPAAHSLKISSDGPSVRRYWVLEPARRIDLPSDADYEDAFRSAFFDAVGARLRTQAPITAMLSGGLDSSSVTVVARELLGSSEVSRLPLRTVSARFRAMPAIDEYEYMRAVVALGSLQPKFVFPENFGPLEDWEGAAWRGDEPELIPQRTIMRSLYEATAELGSNCVLDGDGGDLVVSHGRERLTHLARAGLWIRLIRETRALSRRTDAGMATLLREFALTPFLPVGLSRLRQRLRRRRAADSPLWTGGVPLTADFKQEAQLEERYGAMPRQMRRLDPRRAALEQLMLPQFELPIFDRMAALFGVEPRYPFFDSQLVELCVAIPADQKLRNGYNRDVMRRALSHYLPPRVASRTNKAGSGAHITQTLPETGRPVIEHALRNDLGGISRYVELDEVRRQYTHCLHGGSFHEWNAVWRVVVGALWLTHARTRYALQN